MMLKTLMRQKLLEQLERGNRVYFKMPLTGDLGPYKPHRPQSNSFWKLSICLS
jgi:hypothetical protein